MHVIAEAFRADVHISIYKSSLFQCVNDLLLKETAHRFGDSHCTTSVVAKMFLKRV